jgi:hypothetical protein
MLIMWLGEQQIGKVSTPANTFALPNTQSPPRAHPACQGIHRRLALRLLDLQGVLQLPHQRLHVVHAAMGGACGSGAGPRTAAAAAGMPHAQQQVHLRVVPQAASVLVTAAAGLVQQHAITSAAFAITELQARRPLCTAIAALLHAF